MPAVEIEVEPARLAVRGVHADEDDRVVRDAAGDDAFLVGDRAVVPHPHPRPEPGDDVVAPYDVVGEEFVPRPRFEQLLRRIVPAEVHLVEPGVDDARTEDVGDVAEQVGEQVLRLLFEDAHPAEPAAGLVDFFEVAVFLSVGDELRVAESFEFRHDLEPVCVRFVDERPHLVGRVGVLGRQFRVRREFEQAAGVVGEVQMERVEPPLLEHRQERAVVVVPFRQADDVQHYGAVRERGHGHRFLLRGCRSRRRADNIGAPPAPVNRGGRLPRGYSPVTVMTILRSRGLTSHSR